MTAEHEELARLADQHKPGTVHTRDLGNPCQGCGAPGPTTLTYCERCMIALLASTIRQLSAEKANLRRAVTDLEGECRQLSRDLEVTYGNYTNALEVGRQWEARAEAVSRDLEEARRENERLRGIADVARASDELADAVLREVNLYREIDGEKPYDHDVDAIVDGAVVPWLRRALSPQTEEATDG